MDDAVTGISRADSANWKMNGPMLRQNHVVCNSSRHLSYLLMPDWQRDCARASSQGNVSVIRQFVMALAGEAETNDQIGQAAASIKCPTPAFAGRILISMS